MSETRDSVPDSNENVSTEGYASLPVAEDTPLVLVVVDGPDRGARLVLDSTKPSRVLVGQSSACELLLSDRQVSRRHLALEIDGAVLRVKDLGSTNGTFANGVRVVEALVGRGDTLRVGGSTLRIAIADVEEVAAPLPVRDERFGTTLGQSSEMRRLYRLCRRLAASDVPIVVEGETGTGKEVLARSIHETSARARGPFVVFDCTSVAPTLIESALFGHERGAFTGATSQRRGAFEQAHGGTLLIDEIGDLDVALQPKLLRALQRSEIQRVGSERWQHVDVRVIAATRRDLDHEVTAGRFRDDLFFRLAVGRVELPPLRRRRGDVELLARHFWGEFGGTEPIPHAFLAKLLDEPWPGNVRELENSVARRIALGDALDDLEDCDPGAAGAITFDRAVLEQPFARAKAAALAELERQYVEHAVARHGGNVARAAAFSELALRYFQILRARHRE